MAECERTNYVCDPSMDNAPTALQPTGLDVCHDGKKRHSRFWRLNLGVVPFLATAALPKCPLCLMATFSWVGLGALIQAEWVFPLTMLFLSVALSILAFHAGRRRGYGPLLVGVVAALAILFGKTVADAKLSTYAGMTLMILASLWNSWPKKKASSQAGCDC